MARSSEAISAAARASFSLHGPSPTQLAHQLHLEQLIEKFLDRDINLSPQPAGDLPDLDNHSIGTLFEELVRRFNEDNNEEAGEHWTPRDAVRLMANLMFLPVADRIESGTQLLASPFRLPPHDGVAWTRRMGLLTFSFNVTLDGGVDHQEGIHSLTLAPTGSAESPTTRPTPSSPAWSRRSRSTAARSPCTTGGRADSAGPMPLDRETREAARRHRQHGPQKTVSTEWWHVLSPARRYDIHCSSRPFACFAVSHCIVGSD